MQTKAKMDSAVNRFMQGAKLMTESIWIIQGGAGHFDRIALAAVAHCGDIIDHDLVQIVPGDSDRFHQTSKQSTTHR